MRKTDIFLTVATTLALIGCLLLKSLYSDVKRFKAPSTPLVLAPEPVEIPLSEFTATAMDACNAKLSEARRKILSNQIARAAEETFKKRRHQEAAVLLVCIESRYDSKAQSNKKATGLTQVMPQYADDFAIDCGLGKLEPSDLLDSEVNLRIGFCQFNSLLTAFEGNTALALSAYNSGSVSSTTKGLKRMQTGNQETMGYIAKFSYIREAVRLANQ